MRRRRYTALRTLYLLLSYSRHRHLCLGHLGALSNPRFRLQPLRQRCCRLSIQDLTSRNLPLGVWCVAPVEHWKTFAPTVETGSKDINIAPRIRCGRMCPSALSFVAPFEACRIEGVAAGDGPSKIPLRGCADAQVKKGCGRLGQRTTTPSSFQVSYVQHCRHIPVPVPGYENASNFDLQVPHMATKVFYLQL